METDIIEKDVVVKELRDDNISVSQANAAFKISEIDLRDRLTLLISQVEEKSADYMGMAT